MLPWRPAKTREAVLAIQSAIGRHPEKFDWEQLYYYVTGRDCATALGITDPHAHAGIVKNPALSSLFADIAEENICIFFTMKDDVGFFVSEKALLDAGILPPSWDAPQVRRGRPPTAHVR